MTDRDRLAADLREVLWGVPVDVEEMAAIWTGYADRLIALGWTRLDGSYDPLTHDEMAELVRNPMLVHLYDAHRLVAALARPLDEERLARALRMELPADVVYAIRPTGDPFDGWAAAIAKAYREDAE